MEIDKERGGERERPPPFPPLARTPHTQRERERERERERVGGSERERERERGSEK
jgi:hypothetical protein